MATMSLEQQLFYWQGWDDIGAQTFQYYGIQLKCRIGKFSKGAHFEIAVVCYEKCELTLQRGEETWKFKLKLEAM